MTMDEHKLNQVATLIAVSVPDVVILLEQVKRLWHLCEAVDQANAFLPIHGEDKKQFIFTQWGQICGLPPGLRSSFCSWSGCGWTYSGHKSHRSCVSHQPHQKHLRRVGSPQSGGKGDKSPGSQPSCYQSLQCRFRVTVAAGMEALSG